MSVKLPKDAKGREIPFDTECLYTHDGEKQSVLSFTYYREKDRWEIETDTYIVHSIYLYITPPDSWEKLEEDLARCIEEGGLCVYYSPSGRCSTCILDRKDPCSCNSIVLEDIEKRIRKLRGES